MKKSGFVKVALSTVTTLGMLLGASPLTLADANTAGTTWTVHAGQWTADNSIAAMAFFPNVIVIDAGDTVNFVGSDHTISFPGSDGKLPAPGSPESMAPAGGSTYDGSTFTSSGMLAGGKTYALSFTKPGVYPYYCDIHAGMQGVVIVQSTGSAYPKTQAQYDAQGAAQAQEDLAAAQKALGASQLTSTSNADGTTTWNVLSDLPEPLTYSFNLASNSGITGVSTLSMTKPGVWQVEVKLSGLKPGQSYTPSLSLGESDSGVSVPNSQFSPVTAASDGTAAAVGTVNALAIPQGIWILDINDASGQSVASGTVDYPSYAYERFVQTPLNIHVGDTVVWTQVGPNEAHTISFLPSSWTDVPDESLMAKPAGGSVFSGDDSFYNSGLLFPGQSYQLTFTKAGSYAYRCLLHDMMGMYGEVNVLPAGQSLQPVTLNLNGVDVPDSSVHVSPVTGRVLASVDTFAKHYGATFTWDDASSTLTLNGVTVSDQYGAPQMYNGVLTAPIRALQEALGGDHSEIGWESATSTVNVAILPAGTVPLDGHFVVPMMGEHWANPKYLPLGPIFGVYHGKLIFLEYMVDNAYTVPVTEIPGTLGVPIPSAVDHTEIDWNPHGHPGDLKPHHDVHLYFISVDEQMKIR